MAVDPIIKQKAEDIRHKIYGKEVRESLASGLEAMSDDVVEVTDRQASVEEQFQDVLDETTGKDVISAPEVILARDGEANLKARLDKNHNEVTAQLAQTNSTSLDWINIEKMPPPYAQAKGDGLFDNTGVIQAAIDNFNTIFIPDGIFKFDGEIRQTKSFKIIGSSHLSRLRCYGTFISDTDSMHRIVLSGFTFENYREHGVAMMIEKYNTASAVSSLDIDGVFFFSNNNVSNELDSTSIYIKGIRESNISNCLFSGRSSAYGSAISFGASNTQMTMNISLSGNIFYNYGKFISAKTENQFKVYLAGFRIIDNTFIGGKNAIDLQNVDTVHIVNNMIDYVTTPIYMVNTTGYNIINNYLQSLDGAQLIMLINNSTSTLKYGIIKGNTFWSTNDTYTTDGIVMIGSVGQIAMPIISENNFNKLKTCINLSNVFNANVNNNMSENSKVFYDGNGNSSLAKHHHNFAEQSVVEMFKNLGAASIISESNYHGIKASNKKGRIILNGDGSTSNFVIPHGLFKIPSYANVTPGSPNARGDYYVTFDATNLTIVYATAPLAGTSNVILNWTAEV